AQAPSNERAATANTAQAPSNERAATANTAQAPSTSNYERRVAELVNVERQKNGLAPLAFDSSISNVARIKSKDMSDNNYFAHQSPTYGSAADMLTQNGIRYSAWGENIAAGQRTPEEVVNAWMNSPGHRANILGSQFTKIGVGYVNGSRPYWTQMFTN
ncbi:MAG TPA: CAP domain-containing protein, partial [Sedimentibacter sp.]|nr:CAP domain-containing protein [Sedimentibacter sp.]